MPCVTFQTKDGPVTAFICGGRRARLCPFCHNQYVAKLCDFKKSAGKTCNNGMCEKCATSVGADLDYCPVHKHEPPPPQQSLFGETL